MKGWDTIYILVLLGSYLVGGIPTGTLVSRLRFGKDIRSLGSGNPGAVNVWRVFGVRYGLLVVCVDIGKGWFAAGVLPSIWGASNSTGLAASMALAAVCGHVWSPWTGFRGGKGVGAAFGTGLALYPAPAVICLGLWIVALALSRYAVVASLTAAAAYPPAVYWKYDPGTQELLALIIIFTLLFYTHRANLRRLWNGSELRVGGGRIQLDR